MSAELLDHDKGRQPNPHITMELPEMPEKHILSDSSFETRQTGRDADSDTGENEGTDDETTATSGTTCVAFVRLKQFKMTLVIYSPVIWRVTKGILLLLYLVYTAYSLYNTWGTEGATRLLLLLVIVLYVTAGRRLLKLLKGRVTGVHVCWPTVTRIRIILRWLLYVAAVVGAVAYVALQVAPYRPHNLISLAGIAFLLLTGLLLSTDPAKVNWHAVFWGTAIQFYLAIFVLRTTVGYNMVHWAGDRVTEYIRYTYSGSRFLFGDAYTMHRFVFKAMPSVVFMNSTIAVLYHYGIIQTFIATFGRFLNACLGTSPIESVNAAAGIFIGLAEAPLFIKPFLDEVTESELFAIMTGNYASISGSTMGAIISFGIPANHVLAASVMSAPAALAVAKLMCPDHTPSTIKAEDAYNVNTGASRNLLEVVSKAAVAGVSVVVTICANILVFVAFLDFADHTVNWFGEQAGLRDLSFRRILSYLFYPLMCLCGVDSEDLLTIGRLVGVKILTSAQLGYKQAAAVIENSVTFTEYRSLSNGTWHYHGDDLVLDAWNRTLVGGVMTDRSVVMSTYIMCGFCNVAAMAVAVGTLTSLAPKRTGVVLKHVVRANIAANIACFMTGCMA
ncbi:hypothetical protein BaRGS_00036887, partial [Batillaria attramentaria]